MDQKKCEDSRQTALNFKCKKVIPGVEKTTALSPATVQNLGIVGNQSLETKIASQTPEKRNELLHAEFKERHDKIPEKYRTIAEFFDSMNCSLRLLSLRKKLPTFQNICTQVEVLTKRKFSYMHLAQIKYILPEAIQIEKVLVHDQMTLCMKPDMKITLLFDITEGHHELSDFIALQQVFASRLINFFTAHQEACDIPEAILPDPFSKRSQTTIPELLPAYPIGESLSNSSGDELLELPFHLYQHFNKHFSQKAVVTRPEKTKLLASPVHLSPVRSDNLNIQDIESGQQKELPGLCSKSGEVINQDIKDEQQKEIPDICSKLTIISHPLQLIHPQCSGGSIACESPPVKLASCSDNLTIETPAQSTPKRSMPGCDDMLKSFCSGNRTSNHKPAKRSLNFSHLGDDDSALISIVDESECYKLVLDNVPHTLETKGTFEDKGATVSPVQLQKAEKSFDQIDCIPENHKMNQSSLAMCQQMSSRLDDLVGIIHSVFHSANCSSITKAELVHKIIMNNYDIVERTEVEEQIELLEKLVPDWIFRESAASGDTLYNIKKVLNLDSIQKRVIGL